MFRWFLVGLTALGLSLAGLMAKSHHDKSRHDEDLRQRVAATITAGLDECFRVLGPRIVELKRQLMVVDELRTQEHGKLYPDVLDAAEADRRQQLEQLYKQAEQYGEETARKCLRLAKEPEDARLIANEGRRVIAAYHLRNER